MRQISRICVILFLCLAGLSALAGRADAQTEGQRLFVERFDREDGRLSEKWEVTDGAARVEGGRLRILSEQQNPIVRLSESFEGDLSVSMRLMDSPTCHWSGMVLRGVLWVTVNRQYGALLVERRPERKQLGKAAGYSEFLWDPYDFVMRVDCVGDAIRVYLDDRLFVETSEPGLPSEGGVMLVGGYGTNIGVDDVLVCRPAPFKAIPAPPDPPRPDLSEFKASLDRQDAVYHDGETAQLALAWRAAESSDALVQATLIDLYESAAARFECSVKEEKGAPARAVLPLTAPRRGVFKVCLTVERQGQAPAPQGDVTSFTVIPRELAERPEAVDSPFGGHPHWEAPEFHYPLARKIGMRWARNHDAIQYTWWPRVQPTAQEWRWYDEPISFLHANKLHLLGEFLYVPDWAARPDADPDRRATLPPRDMQDFDRYVFETTLHYRGKIRYWEVWNEPHYSGFWRGTPEEYVELLKTAHQAVRRADPGCVVIGGGGVALISMDWIERALKAGLLQYCDAFSFHYGYEGKPLQAEADRFRNGMNTLRALMRQYGTEKPLWNTEATVLSTSFLDPVRARFREADAHYHFREAAFKLVRMYVMNLAEGVQKIFYYDLLWPRRKGFIESFLNDPVNGRLLELHGGLKPAGAAYATTAHLLEGARFRQIVRMAPGVEAFLFVRGDEHIAVYWGNFQGVETPPASLFPQPVGEWVLCDVMNNRRPLERRDGRLHLPLSREPFFILASGLSAAQFAAAWESARIQ